MLPTRTLVELPKKKGSVLIHDGKEVHIVCKACGWVTHSDTYNNSLQQFLVNYEEHRPIMGPLKAAKLVTRTHVTWNAHEKALAADLWKIIRDEVGKCRIFGVAIDAAVDRVLARFILIIVMYVGSLVFELPPVYEPNGEAFNGAKAGKAIFDSLMLNLGIINDTKVPLAAKCRYLMVDGCGVNHCARAELSALVKEHLNDHCTPVGTNDYQDLNNSFRAKGTKMCLLTGVRHFIDNVAADSFTHWDDTLLFQVRKLFT